MPCVADAEAPAFAGGMSQVGTVREGEQGIHAFMKKLPQLPCEKPPQLPYKS